MQVEVKNEHHWLLKMLGDWTYESECIMGPDQPPSKSTGSESVRSVGDVWVMCEGEMPCEGKPMTTVMTLGYDTAKKRFVGTFLGSMMTNLWVYDGSLDAAGKVLTLNAEGPSFADPNKTTMYHDMIEFHSDDHRTLSSEYLADDGKWHKFMNVHYRRKK